MAVWEMKTGVWINGKDSPFSTTPFSTPRFLDTAVTKPPFVFSSGSEPQRASLCLLARSLIASAPF